MRIWEIIFFEDIQPGNLQHDLQDSELPSATDPEKYRYANNNAAPNMRPTTYQDTKYLQDMDLPYPTTSGDDHEY